MPDTPAGDARSRGSSTQGSAPNPRAKPAAQRRRELLDAGLEVFTSKGVTSATVDQVTRAANVAKGTFYLHFESKEHLLAALQDDFEARLVERVEQAAEAAGDDSAARLSAWVRAAFAHYPEDIALHDVLFHHPVLPQRRASGEHADSGSAAKHPASARRDLADSLHDLIERGREQGEFDLGPDPADAELTALLLCSALHRMFDQIWHRDEEVDPDRLLGTTLRLFHRTVASPY